MKDFQLEKFTHSLLLPELWESCISQTVIYCLRPLSSQSPESDGTGSSSELRSGGCRNNEYLPDLRTPSHLACLQEWPAGLGEG